MAITKTEEQIDSNGLFGTIAKEVTMAFGDAVPEVVPHESGQEVELLHPFAVAAELASLKWTTRRPGIFEGRPREEEATGLWIGSVEADHFSLTNMGVASPNGIRELGCFLPDPDKGTRGFMKVVTSSGVLMYQSELP